MKSVNILPLMWSTSCCNIRAVHRIASQSTLSPFSSNPVTLKSKLFSYLHYRGKLTWSSKIDKLCTLTAFALGTIADIPWTLQQLSLAVSSWLSVTVRRGLMTTLMGTSSIPRAFRLSFGVRLTCCGLRKRKMRDFFRLLPSKISHHVGENLSLVIAHFFML